MRKLCGYPVLSGALSNDSDQPTHLQSTALTLISERHSHCSVCHFDGCIRDSAGQTLQYDLAPEVIKLLSCSTQLSMSMSLKFILLINLKILTIFFKTSFMLNSAEHAQLS